MNELRVSVVIPTHNRAAEVARAVESVLAQCRQADEVIVVDDGSGDGTEACLAPYRDRIVYLRAPHGGVGKARNLGMRRARNPLLAFLDSDDEWMPGKLDLQRQLMRAAPEVLLCFSDLAHRDASGRVYHGHLFQCHDDPRSWDEILGPGRPYSTFAALPQGRSDFRVHVGRFYVNAMKRDYIYPITAMVRREEAGEALWFPEDLPVNSDWGWFGRLAREGLVAYMQCETAWNCKRGGRRVSEADQSVRALSRIVSLQRVWGTDAEFLAHHRQEYEATLREWRLRRIRALIALGQTRQARKDLRETSNSPLLYRILSSLPGNLARKLVAVRRALRRAVRRPRQPVLGSIASDPDPAPFRRKG